MSFAFATLSGRYVDLDAPHWNHIDLDDMAVSLARLPRFLGHTGGDGTLPVHGGVWSVAQHSLYVRDLVGLYCRRQEPVAVARAYAILHDGHEYLIGDIVSPVKRLMQSRGLDFEREIAAPVQRAIHESFVLPEPDEDVAAAVRNADRRAYEMEARLFKGDGRFQRKDTPAPSALLRLSPPDMVAAFFADEVRADLTAATGYIAGSIAAESALRLEAEAARHQGA